MAELDSGASDASQARIVGNLAGVVEWANDAFARLSGIALDDTVDKPVGRLLERAGIDLEVVEFVAQHFFEGRLCRVAFPFERPDGRRIDVLLEVEALRDALGEIDRFSAIAREEVPTAAAESNAPNASTAPTAPAATARPRRTTSPAATPLALAPAIERAVARARASWASGADGATRDLDPTVELDLETGLGPVAVSLGAEAAGEAVEALVTTLLAVARLGIEEAANAGAVLTVSTARLAPQRRFVSRVHPIPACPPGRSEAGDVVLEVHDTGRALPAPVVEAFRSGEILDALTARPSERTRALAEAWLRAQALGARIHLDSTPGCGTQLLALFAPAQAAARAPAPAPAAQAR